MEESQSRRGASAYADVFATQFAARLDDYAEVFGDLAGSCSIPFFDLRRLRTAGLPGLGLWSVRGSL
ncbi:hypothetical protein B296_00002896 [Ensete ventricosum]|uniref:Uncharacterized protein n=1 Tax=Ensete ventricosum TaxID=4639 RepID=A0A427B2F0_ENSVE|nr:hypothetical protein B296_00002896 [Ensete ventricosum]